MKTKVSTEWLSGCAGCHVAVVDLHEKLPLHSFEEALQLQVHTLPAVWIIHPEFVEDKLTITVSNCFIRDICNKE